MGRVTDRTDGPALALPGPRKWDRAVTDAICIVDGDARVTRPRPVGRKPPLRQELGPPTQTSLAAVVLLGVIVSWIVIWARSRGKLGHTFMSALRLASGAMVCAMWIACSGCRTAAPATASVPIVQPGAPGQPSLTIDAIRAVDLSNVRFTSADVEFMQGMISHHAQAIEMTDLLATRTARDVMKKLAGRIDI